MRKMRKWLSALVLICVSMSLFGVLPTKVVAAEEWTYVLKIYISHKKDSSCGNGNVRAYLQFDDFDSSFVVNNTNQKGAVCETEYTTGMAPWTLRRLKIENNTKDGFKMRYISLDVKKKGASKTYALISEHYPKGTGKDDGLWIQTDDGDDPTYTMDIYTRRSVKSVGNFGVFGDFSKTLYIDAFSDDRKLSYEYNGMIKDQYSDIVNGGDEYYCMDMSTPPTLSYEVSGQKPDKSHVSKTELAANGLTEKENKRGFDIDTAKLREYMNKNNINMIKVDSKLDVPCFGSISNAHQSATMNIYRNTFSIKDLSLSSNYYVASADNYFYNNVKKDSNGKKTITLTGKVKTGDNNQNMDWITWSFFGSANYEMKFSEANLILGNTGKKITSSQKSVWISNGSFSLTFPYEEGMDSKNGGLRLELKNAKIERYGPGEYKLWDETAKKEGVDFYASSYKVDTVNPDIKYSASKGQKLDEWNKTVSLSLVPTENIYASLDGKTLSDNICIMELYNGKNKTAIYDYRGSENPGTSQSVPAAEGSEREVTVALRDKIEGQFDLKLTGQDRAGNPLDVTVKGLMLDNKAPGITVTETGGKPDNTGIKEKRYKVSISDASGTGRLYYCFAEGLTNTPFFDRDSAQKQTSGTLDTLINKWAYIDQSDVSGGKEAEVYLKVEKGKNFSGRMIYFGEDAFGNKTDMSYRTIDIVNEDTQCSIDAENDSAVPHSSYKIFLTTNPENKVWYRWKNRGWIGGNDSDDDKFNLTEYKLYDGKGINTADNNVTKNLDGTYILQCKVVPPSGEKSAVKVEKAFAFDNSGPRLRVSTAVPGAYRETHTISVSGTDASGIREAYAALVRPDGTKIEGEDEFAVNISGGTVSENINISGAASGAYALLVRAVDQNGMESTEKSDTFFIRNAEPESEIHVVSDRKFDGKPLVSDAKYKLSFEVSEAFANAKDAGAQNIYYRVSTDGSRFGAWIKAAKVTAAGETLRAAFTADAPYAAAMDGKNTVYVQTAVAAENADTGKINLNTVRTDEVTFFYDETPPQSRLIIEDIHTSESIEGKLYLTDNLSAQMKVECADKNVSIKMSESEEESGLFVITVAENTNTVLKACDEAGNVTEIPLIIKGIDREPPTAEAEVWQKTVGARTDGKATVTVADVLEESVKFAFIPKAERENAMTDGKIRDAYFDNFAGEAIRASKTVLGEGAWDDEKELCYDISVAGVDADYYIGIRMADSLGNSRDMIFADVISAKNAEVTFDYSASPEKTADRAIVKAKFNMPVYVLPQDKIISDIPAGSDADDIDEANLEIAKQNTSYFGDEYSFGISANGEYKLYVVDDIGRIYTFAASVGEEMVQFGALGGTKAVTYAGGEEVAKGNMAGVNARDSETGQQIETTVKVVPTEAGMLLMPVEDRFRVDGLEFSEYKSESYKSEDGNGYSALVYDVYTKTEEKDGYYVGSRSNERMIETYIFQQGNTQTDTWGKTLATVSNIDNTEPDVGLLMTPDIVKYDKNGNVEKIIYTPGNVSIIVNAQDPDSGIGEIILGEFTKDNENYERLRIPLSDAGEWIDYSKNPWTWSGEEYGLPVNIEFFGDKDPKGIKTIKYTFTDNCDLQAPIFYNGAGDMAMGMVWQLERFGTLDSIRKTEIEEGEDYTLEYRYEAEDGTWVDMTDDVKNGNTDRFYRRAKAVIVPQSRAGERGLFVANNGGLYEKLLDSYEPSFTFKLKDKYGYTKSVAAGLVNFDADPGVIEYTLSETGKTNKPVSVKISATDERSGVGSVTLYSKNGTVDLTEENGEYIGILSENGAYSIVMYDRVGNKTTKNFNIKNIDMKAPKVESVELSTDKVTSKSVSATLNFSKPNVRITYAEPTGTLNETAYSVNYSTSVITFTESGTLSVFFADDYGNEGSEVIKIDNIDKTPPSLSAVARVIDRTEVKVSFEKAKKQNGDVIDKRRELSDITVNYGGIVQKADTAEYVFCKNGIYTFSVYDEEGVSSYLTLEITDIDTAAPNIVEVRWSYEYDEFTDGSWVKKNFSDKKTPNGEKGYVIASDIYPTTNRDVEVTVVTDSETHMSGSGDEYKTENSKTYTDNGLFIFNMEKENKLTDIYGVDIEVIDKTPPVIDLLGKNELVFYENTAMGEVYSKDYLAKPGEAFKAYDVFGKGTDLNDKVEIDWGGFDADNIQNNTFDSNSPYTITYTVSDKAHNETKVRRTVRLVGMYDTVATVNGALPDYAGRIETDGKDITVALKNFPASGTAYVRYQSGVKTMGQMKKGGTAVAKNKNGEFTVSGLERGWYTFYVQTDKRDYFTLQVYLYN